MKPIFKSWLIQIEITNACNVICANCTRFVGHHRKVYFMDLSTIEKAIDSLEGYKGGIGIMGGEPTMHPEFIEICKLLQKKVSSHRCGLWTSGHRWGEYKDVIHKTFGHGVYYNDHSDKDQTHQPILVSIDEVVDNKDLMWKLIDNCWVQEKWSPSINPKGGFFCEVAAAMDILFNGPGGYLIEKNWWNKTPGQYQDQVRRYCPQCSGALPMACLPNSGKKDLVSKGNLEKLLKIGSPKALNGNYVVYDKKITEETINSYRSKWRPWNYLGTTPLRKRDLKLDEIWLNKGFHRIARCYNWIKDLVIR